MSMRKDVYERMKYFVLEKIKPNYSAIARQRVSIILCTFENPSLYEMLT